MASLLSGQFSGPVGVRLQEFALHEIQFTQFGDGEVSKTSIEVTISKRYAMIYYKSFFVFYN